MSSSKSTLGLENLGDLSALLDAPAGGGNRPLDLELSEITEDPNQPRVDFDEETLAELAASIKLRGVKTPISVRPHDVGGYIINHGARRFRASRLAGKTTIPAWIDADYTDEDQIIENIHRDALKPREIAEFIGRKLSHGMQQKDIAKALGKSKGYVSQYAALLDLPEIIAEAFKTERTTDVTLIYELVNCHKKDPEATTSWMASQEVTRGALKQLKEFIEAREASRQTPSADDPAKSRHPDPDRAAPASTLRKPLIGVECEHKKGTLLYTKRPTKPGYAWVRLHNTEREVKIDKIKLISISNA
jgi:ParB family chromosome partitioning protein